EPLQNDLVIGRSRLQAMAALVRDAQRRLHQHQTAGGIVTIHAPAKSITDDRVVVLLGGIRKHAELEPTLAILTGVAGSGIAARLADDGEHLIDKADGWIGQYVANLDGHPVRVASG